MKVLERVLAAVPMDQIDPGVTANSNAPWLTALRDVAGMLLMTMVVVLVIILMIGVALAVGGKLGSMSSAQSTGFMVLVWGLIGAAALGSLSGIVFWATSINLAPAKEPVAALAPLLGLSV